MSTIARSLHLAALPVLILALGCASTRSTTGNADTATADPIADRGVVTAPEVGSMTLSPVYFDTDRSQLRPEARETLARYAKEILGHPEWGVITIEGHCDERGSEEYNLALGRRRATGVQRYLTDVGVPASRLTTRSFGEESPAVRGHGESAWRYNRRSELLLEALSAGR
jgi:peptidoglycan-associated lipoprotein